MTTKLPTQDEIVARIRVRSKNDIFGFETSDYLMYLDFDRAREFLVPDAKREQWKTTPLTYEHVVKCMRDYMDFAWEKANGFRGLSASRSVSHYRAWLWLAGEHELLEWVDDDNNYQHYGKEILVRICEHFGWDASQWDDGVRLNEEP